MADKQILVTGSSDAPEGYTVPNTVELIPKAVSAVFDGTGASGNFVPIVEIVSDGGVVVAQSPASQVSAGGQAEVSWFPRVGGSAGSAAAGALPTAALRQTNTFTWTPSATTPRAISWPRFATTDTSVFSWDSGTGQLTIAQAGLYGSFIIVNPDSDWPTDPTGPIKIGTWGGDTNEPFGISPYGQHPTADVFVSPGGDTLNLASFMILGFSASGAWNGGGMNFSGADFTGGNADAWVWRICDYLAP